MKKKSVRKSAVKKAFIDKTSDEWLFNEVKETAGFKRGYEKEMISELIVEMKAARLKRHLTQHAFASLIGTKQQVIARLEKEGAKDMKLSTFVTIVNELGIDPRRLLHC
jgi:DNA-binding XRE family transcriptional regulator